MTSASELRSDTFFIVINYDTHNWLGQIFIMKGSLLQGISGRVMLCTIWSALVVFFHLHVLEIGMPGTVHTIIGTVLGFFLVFRINASYDRYWEGRKLWSQMTSTNINLVRNCEALLINAPEKRRAMALWAIAYNYAAMNALRGEKGLGPYTKNLDPAKAQQVLNSERPTLVIAKEMSNIIQEAKSEKIITEYAQFNIDNHIKILIQDFETSDRISNTPLPFSYVIHLRRAMLLYCFSFPLVIVDKIEFSWFTILGTMFLAFVYFGVEEISNEIENPFEKDRNDLPLEDYCERIYRDVKILSSVSID